MTHSFETKDAKKYGVNAAVILSNLRFWVAKNQANGRHQYDGQTWTYNSVKAFQELFPYLSSSQIRTALKKLIEGGAIAEGNYNKLAYDRTKWYCVKEKLHLRKISNGFGENREPIPDSKPNTKPDQNNTCPPKPDDSDLLKKLWENSPPTSRNRSSKKKVIQAWRSVKANERPSDEELIGAIKAWRKSHEWTKEGGQFAQGLHIWVKDQRWESLPEAANKERKSRILTPDML